MLFSRLALIRWSRPYVCSVTVQCFSIDQNRFYPRLFSSFNGDIKVGKAELKIKLVLVKVGIG